uniref:Uncharacterized protein n=1 Tax=Glossina austeni TaxID=7395 RepID=A0A1A9URV6_GLOAU
MVPESVEMRSDRLNDTIKHAKVHKQYENRSERKQGLTLTNQKCNRITEDEEKKRDEDKKMCALTGMEAHSYKPHSKRKTRFLEFGNSGQYSVIKAVSR